MPVADIMTAWTAHPGAPLITVADDGSVQQTRLCASGEAAHGAWVIPLRGTLLVTDDSESELSPSREIRQQAVSVLLADAAAPITAATPLLPQPLPPAAVVHMNADSVGYYRVQYSDVGWARVVGCFSALAPAERVALVNDAAALFTLNRLSPATLVNVLVTAMGHASVGVVGAVCACARGLVTVFARARCAGDGDGDGQIRAAAAAAAVAAYVSWLLRSYVSPESLSWDDGHGEAHVDVIARACALRLAVEVAEPSDGVVVEALRRFDGLCATDVSAAAAAALTSADALPVVLYAGVRWRGLAGTSESWRG